MSNFRVGQKVVCVDARPVLTGGVWEPLLVEKQVYTVVGVHLERGLHFKSEKFVTTTTLEVAELKRTGRLAGFDAERFRPLITPEQDIALFHALCPGLPVVPPAVVPKRVPVTSPSD